jgi:PAS domain S-box-containing protein
VVQQSQPHGDSHTADADSGAYERADRLSRVLAEAPDAFLAVDEAGRVLEWNAAATAIAGWRAEEMIGRSLAHTLLPAEYRAEQEARLARYLSTDAETPAAAEPPAELEIVHRDGHRVPVEATIWPAWRYGRCYAFLRDVRERRETAQRLLRQSEALAGQHAFLQAVLENLSDAVVACDGDGELTVFNPAAERLHGLPVEPLPPHLWAERYDLLNADGTPMRMEEIPLYRALRGETVAGTRLLIAPRGMPVRTVVANGRQLRDESGRVLGAVVSMRDVSDALAAQDRNATLLRERTEALAALEVSERRFRLSFDNSPVGMLLVDLRPGAAGRLLQANPVMEEITGYRREELAAMTYLDLTDPADRADVGDLVDELAAGGIEAVTEERRYRHAGGRTVWVDVRVGVIRDGGGRALYLVAQVEDITQRRIEQARLEQQARLLQLIPTPVVVHDLDGTIRGWNGGAEATYGYPAAAVTGRRVHELLATEGGGADPEEITAALVRDGRWTGELTHRGADGRRITVLSRQIMQPGEPSGAAQVLAVNTDITALRDREAELAGFAGVVAHDLKNPLTGIIGFTEMAADLLHDAGPGGAGVPTAARYVTRAKENAQHMDQLIDDLLAFATARDAPLRPDWADLDAMVAHIVTVRTGHLPAPDRPDIGTGDLPAVWADAGMLRQVLDNLIGNAVKYTRPGTRAQVTIGAQHAGAAARISVADRGIGIPADQRAQVLSQFHRAHTGQGYAGTGLGLAICQRVIERHGGTIDIADNPGGGTIVTITLPQPAPPPD